MNKIQIKPKQVYVRKIEKFNRICNPNYLRKYIFDWGFL